MNPALDQLQPYPFEKLRELLGSVQPAADKRPIALSIGEPKHRSPEFVGKALTDNLDKLAVYPTTLGLPELRQSIATWCERRFGVPQGWLDAARHVLPVNGTREALFAFTQAVVDRNAKGLVSAPTRSTRSMKAQRFSPAPSRTTCPAWKLTVSIRISTPCPARSGSAARSCSSARRATPLGH
jgi:aspartate/methionine/tyrosine aminotransferase